MALKFQEHTNDENLNNILRQIEDQIATREDISTLAKKTTAIDKSTPNVKSMKDGEEKLVYDGTNYYIYRKAGGKLFRLQITEV